MGNVASFGGISWKPATGQATPAPSPACPAPAPRAPSGAPPSGNVDNDTQLDAWFIAGTDGTDPSTCPGGLSGGDATAPAGTPFNDYNDVNCP